MAYVDEETLPEFCCLVMLMLIDDVSGGGKFDCGDIFLPARTTGGDAIAIDCESCGSLTVKFWLRFDDGIDKTMFERCMNEV